MKKFSKNSAIVLSVLLIVVLAIGFIFSFVPLDFGGNKFVSLSKTVNISTDLVGGMYGEYNIKTENPSQSDIVDTISLIRNVFEEDGYKNVSVYSVGNEKVRVELSFPNGDESFATTFSKLSNVGAGAFSLANESTIDDDSIVVDGAKHVKEVKVFTNNDQKYISVVFNKEGKAKYQELCQSTTSIYMFLGTYNQSITIQGVTDYSALTLSNDSWTNMIALEQKIKLGCAKVELDGTNAVLNTMSATLSAGESSSSSVDDSFFTSTAFVVAISAFLIIAILILAIFAIKFGLFALVSFISMLIATYLFLFIVWLVPSFELGLSVVLALVVGASITYSYAYNYAKIVKDEYLLGKSLSASLESGYKKTAMGVLINCAMLFFASLILMALSFSELTSVAISFAIMSVLNLFTNLCVIPFLVKLGISFDGLGRKLFMLPKRKGLVDIDEQTKEDK